MDFLLLYQTWLIAAAILGVLELIIPGGILLNLAIASIIVALGVHQHWLDTWVIALTTWFICASVLLFALYFVTEQLFPGDKTIDNTDENLDIFGQRVEVTEDIGPGTKAGRVDFQGSSWAALGDGSQIPKGSLVTVVCKENISLIVEPTVKP